MKRIIKHTLAIFVLMITIFSIGCTETQDTTPSNESNNIVTMTATPELTQTPSTTIEDAKQYIIDELERDSVIVDAGVVIEGDQGSIAVYITNPDEAERVYTLSKTMANVFLKEHNIKSVIIGIYKGDDQLKYGAEWL